MLFDNERKKEIQLQSSFVSLKYECTIKRKTKNTNTQCR